MDNGRSKAGEASECKRESERWMAANFYEEWLQASKAFYCERDPELDDNGKPDTTQTSLGMPDTFANVQRTVARITAQIPDIRFHAKDEAIAELISRTLMWNWDRGKV